MKIGPVIFCYKQNGVKIKMVAIHLIMSTI